MSDQVAAARPANPVAAIQSLTARLASIAPPSGAEPLNIARPSPAVSAALARATTIAAKAQRRTERYRKRSIAGMVVDSFVGACAFIPYALVALVLRLVMARLFFVNGQTMVSGPRVPVNVQDVFSYSVVLPLEVKASTFEMFLTHYAGLPIAPLFAAYLASYANFILPIMLVLGLGTRFAALGLIIMTAMITIVMPDALWATHVYWAAILLVLLSRGAGAISLDHAIRHLTRR